MSNFDYNHIYTDELKKSLDMSSRLADSIRPALELQERLERLYRPAIESSAINNIAGIMKFESPAMKALETINLVSKANKIISPTLLSGSVIDSVGVNAINIPKLHFDMPSINIAESIAATILTPLSEMLHGVLENFSTAIISAIQSPFVDWLSSIDFSPLTRIWENWDIDPSLSSRYHELNTIYLKAMYQAKWFPYAGWIADIELFSEINNILNTSRGMSQRCEKRIDKAILTYYTDKEIKEIKRSWRNSDLDPCLKKMLGHAINAYIRKEYALTISCLATMWEGVIKSKTEENTKNKKEDFKKLVDKNGYDGVFSDFYNKFIIETCYSVEEVIEGVPNRHGVAHSWYKKYPNKKAALNAILLTDFIINLESCKTADTEKSA